VLMLRAWGGGLRQTSFIGTHCVICKWNTQVELLEDEPRHFTSRWRCLNGAADSILFALPVRCPCNVAEAQNTHDWTHQLPYEKTSASSSNPLLGVQSHQGVLNVCNPLLLWTLSPSSSPSRTPYISLSFFWTTSVGRHCTSEVFLIAVQSTGAYTKVYLHKCSTVYWCLHKFVLTLICYLKGGHT
jgi:hypothetical protein